MKDFRFPLQPVKVLREQKERTARQRYAEALRQYEAAAAELNAANEALKQSWTGLNEELAGGAASSKLLRTRAWCNALEARVSERARALHAARVNIDAAWQEMLQATRERESMDRFYDRSKTAYDKEVQRQDQKNLDEIAVQRAVSQSPLCPQM